MVLRAFFLLFFGREFDDAPVMLNEAYSEDGVEKADIEKNRPRLLS